MANFRQTLAFCLHLQYREGCLAAGLLYPLVGLTLSPIFAAVATALSSVSVIGDALRLKRVRF
jgi:P-type Cu+ transporter